MGRFPSAGSDAPSNTDYKALPAVSGSAAATAHNELLNDEQAKTIELRHLAIYSNYLVMVDAHSGGSLVTDGTAAGEVFSEELRLKGAGYAICPGSLPGM